MIDFVIAFACSGLFVALCWFLEDKVSTLWMKVYRLIKWTRHLDDRVSSLEIKETSQDERLDQHDQRFHE
ncbi:MAG TPA: hypothetical protein VM656_15010, partial [Pyrinomonadaceae bacterium]|nr:hypothetical protein [Pyrinomonadaceae bacterium]